MRKDKPAFKIKRGGFEIRQSIIGLAGSLKVFR